MKRSSYRERDYAFGQAMLTLRTAIGLTQADLAEFLGVSRKAVGGWESGGSYPKAEHLKALLTLAVQEGTFPAGREAEEIRAFWKAAHQKALLDESWLSALLSQHLRSLERMLPPSIDVTGDATPALAAPASGPRVDWGDVLEEPRVLLVLDNLEALLAEGEVRGHLRPGYEDYSRLLQRVAETAHQSCLLLTSREKPAALRALEGRKTPVRSLRLGGLEASACEPLLASHELLGSPQEQARLVERYAGNPLALNMVAETIADLFGGELAPFLAQDTLVFGSISDLLDEQVGRLSTLEQTLLYWLAIAREPLTLQELGTLLMARLSPVQVLEAVDRLRRRSLIERGQRLGSFTLQSVVLEYVSAHLVAQASEEIVQGWLSLLIQYGLCQAQARDYVRLTQERLLVAPL